jgi:GNAT superfamily N-acetyltransferase/RimJ/RimL family protein N-acetyltransferase
VSTIEIRDLDRTDDTQIRTFWEVVGESVAERPYNTWLAWVAARTYLADPPNDSEAAALCAWDGDRMIATAAMSAPRLDNLHRSSVDIYVLPDRRREGIGTALLEETVRRVRAWDRTVLATEVFAPIGEESPGLAFAQRHGFGAAIEDGIKIADLQATKDSWPALAAEAAAYHPDYRLVTTWDPMPEELIEGYCRLNTKFFSLAPTGESDVEDEVWEPARVRERERRGVQARRRDLYTMALDASGEPVGMTEMFINETMAHRVFQSGTLVLPEHQGHRLGLAVKVANQQAMLERFPDAEWVITGNADVNAPMNAVNDRLGFRIVERCIEMERKV